MKGPELPKLLQQKEDKRPTLPDFQLYHRTLVTKTDQLNKIENPEINPHI